MILKKLPPVGKRKFNQAFFGGEKTEKAWQEGIEEEEEEEEEEVEEEEEEEEEEEVEEEEKADVDKGVESNREIQMRKK